MRKRFALFVLATLVLLETSSLHAADERKIRLLNVSLHPLFTLASSAFRGQLHTRADVSRCLITGFFGGYAFYESKIAAGRGDIRTALVVANLASSLTSNVAAGRHPLARLGITIGPARAEFSTPFEQERSAMVYIGLSAYETASLMRMRSASDKMEWRDGLIAFRKRQPYHGDGRDFGGYTFGVFPGTQYGTVDSTWNHEVIHAIQAMQRDALEPSYRTWLRRREQTPAHFKLVRLEPLNLGVFPSINDGLIDRQDYTDRWTEIEAWRLAQGRAPR